LRLPQHVNAAAWRSPKIAACGAALRWPVDPFSPPP